MSLTSVSGFVSSANLILYPIAVPNLHPSWLAIRAETPRAAIRRGCVWPIKPATP